MEWFRVFILFMIDDSRLPLKLGAADAAAEEEEEEDEEEEEEAVGGERVATVSPPDFFGVRGGDELALEKPV